MTKLTKAQVDAMARVLAMEEIDKNGLANFIAVAGTKFAMDFMVEGVGVRTVRVDIVVPKLEEGENAETLNADYNAELEIKAVEKAEKAEKKAKKIARDTAQRAKAKAEKGE